MFMRLIQIKINSEYLVAFPRFYEYVILPELQKMDGCSFASLLQSHPQPEEFLSLTLWKTKTQAESYEKSGVFIKLFEKAKPFLSESSEWKINLTESLELKYEPESDEPKVSAYTVTAQKEDYDSTAKEDSQMYVRLFKVKVQDNMLDECRNIYHQEILPVLKLIEGCCCAYLVESIQNPNQAISLTIWNSKKKADNYEQSGTFEALVGKVEHTFSPSIQWKLGFEKNNPGKISSKKDTKLEYYSMIIGRRF